MSLDEAKEAGLYQTIGADIDDPYIEELKGLVLHQDSIDAVKDKLTIVYSPLHGTGNIPVRRVLKELGFQNVHVVPEQELRTETSRRLVIRIPKLPKRLNWDLHLQRR